MRTDARRPHALAIGAGARRSVIDAVAAETCESHDLSKLAALGEDELVVVAGPPADPVAATEWVTETAEQWMRALPQ